MKSCKGLFLSLSLFVYFFTFSAYADDWEFEIAPYIFGTSLSGETGVAEVTSEIDMSFGDVLDHLDSALMATFVASNGQWSIMADGFYAKLEGEGAKSWSGPGGINSLTGDLEISVTQQIYQLMLAYRMSDEGTVVDLFGGFRYTQLDNDLQLTVTGGPTLPGGGLSVDDSKSWVDPIVGARFLTPVSDNWTFMTYLDFGFGQGESNGSYQAMAGFNWDGGGSWGMKFGYRYLNWDYEDDDSGYIWDMVMEGLYAGVGIQF